MAAATLGANTPATPSAATTSPVIAAPVADTSHPAKMEFPLAGYRINTYDPTAKEGFTLTMALPVPGKSSSFSVSVIRFLQMKTKPPLPISFYPRSGYTVLSQHRASPTELRVEFTKSYHGAPKDHDYSLSIFVNDRLYSVTATTSDTDWREVGAKLKTYVESFEPSPDPAPGKVAFPRQGFRISLLDEALPADSKQKLLLIEAPGENTMSVSVEPYTKTLKDYKSERKPTQMFDSKHKFKILEESEPAENALVTEYAEEFLTDKNHPPIQLLSYEKVVLTHGQLYRASSFPFPAKLPMDPKSLTQVKTWVESLEAMPIPAPAK
jgi:hypothetical protein